MTNVILFTAFLLAAAFFALAAGELRGIRQTVRKRSDRLTAELHTVEALLAEHKDVLNGLKSGSEASDAAYTAFFRSLESDLADIRKDYERRYRDLKENLQTICRGLVNMGQDIVQIREIQEVFESLEKQDAVLNDLKIDLSALISEVCQPVNTAPDCQSEPDRQSGSDLDARLSKSMEEGVLNLMQYAAGKTSGGVEVGLG